jgi:hypothetical protein
MIGSHYSQACVGYPDGDHFDRVWFTRWFLDQCYFDAPAVIWQRDGNIITRTYKPEYRRLSGLPNPPPMIWKLTDQRDIHGRRLGVWPD